MGRIPFEGRLTEDQFVRLKMVNMGWAPRLLPWFILCCLGFMVLFGGYYQAMVARPLRMAPFFILLVVAAVMTVLPGWSVRRQWASDPGLREGVSGVADESGVEWTGPTMTGRYPWKGLVGHRLADDVVLLYPKQSRISFLYFPRTFFGDESSWRAFRALVRASRLARR